MKVKIAFTILLFLNTLNLRSQDSCKCSKLTYLRKSNISMHQPWETYVFIDKKSKNHYYIHVDSNQATAYPELENYKNKDLELNKKYFICYTKISYSIYSGQVFYSFRDLLIGNNEKGGEQYKTNDIQNNMVLRRKKGDSKTYWKREPLNFK